MIDYTFAQTLTEESREPGSGQTTLLLSSKHKHFFVRFRMSHVGSGSPRRPLPSITIYVPRSLRRGSRGAAHRETPRAGDGPPRAGRTPPRARLRAVGPAFRTRDRGPPSDGRAADRLGPRSGADAPRSRCRAGRTAAQHRRGAPRCRWSTYRQDGRLGLPRSRQGAVATPQEVIVPIDSMELRTRASQSRSISVRRR